MMDFQRELPRLTATAEKITGQVYCGAGNHFVAASDIMRRSGPRRTCKHCVKKAIERSKTERR